MLTDVTCLFLPTQDCFGLYGITSKILRYTRHPRILEKSLTAGDFYRQEVTTKPEESFHVRTRRPGAKGASYIRTTKQM